MKQFSTLVEWLAYLETLHTKAIAMGLDRVSAVYRRLEVHPTPGDHRRRRNGKARPAPCRMHAACRRLGGIQLSTLVAPQRTGAIDAVEVSDDALLEAFAVVESAQQTTPLTYFGSVPCHLWLLARAELDVMVLEVGLGGRPTRST